MHAMQLRRRQEPLVPVELPDPDPGAGEVRVRVASCGVCRTDLHVVDGELQNPKVPVIPGHEIDMSLL
jgi:propanol-preferring alcohol dehydrogenase